MRLFVMRHGQAVPTAPSDEQRPLTSHGRSEVAVMARQHLIGIEFNQVYVSPYLRAQQSWGIIQTEAVQYQAQYTVDWITPESSTQKAVDNLVELVGESESVLLVCHQPFVGKFATKLCEGHDYGLQVATAGLVILETEVIARECATLLNVYKP